MGNYFVNRHYLPEPDLPEYEHPLDFYPDTLLAHQPFEIGSAGLNIYTEKNCKPDSRCVPGTVKWKLNATELRYLGLFHNPNMVDIVGRHVSEYGIPYLVNNFVPNGNLRQHLDGDYGLLSWDARERICIGVVEEIGHHKRISPLINWDHLKSEHILLGLDYNPKISISTLPTTDNNPGTLRQDVYGLGVMFLEIITGLKAIDNTRPVEHQKLEDWVSHCIRIHGNDEWDFKQKEKLQAVIDHRLQGKYSDRALSIFMIGLQSAIVDKERRQFLNRVIHTMSDVHEEIREKSVINSSITLVHNLDLMTIRHSIDDVCNVYGSLDELELFTAAVDRSVSGLEFLSHWADFWKAMLVEAKWSKMVYMSLLKEYLENAWISSATTIGLVHAFFRTEQPVTDDAIEGLNKKQDHITTSPQYNPLINGMPLLLPSTCIRLGAPKCDILPYRFNNASSRRNTGIFRQCTNSQKSIWTHDFVESLQGDYKMTYVERVEKLKEEVKVMLNDETVGSLTKLELIDDLQRLGIGYHFEKEIKRTLLDILRLYKDTIIEDNLHFRVLYFRLLRQHGYKVSQDVFKDFISKTGSFRLDLCEDVKGMLSLYEASHLCLEGENILHDARDFTVKHLNLVNDNMDPRITEEVTRALELPLHWKLPRLEARDYIDMYQRKQKMNPALLELAQLDFDVLQAMHQEELKNMSRWWKHLGLSDKLNFARDRLVEAYLWSVGLAYKPEHQRCREWIAKFVSLIITLDDIYDIHDSLHELELLTTAIERWDLKEVEQLPDYMRIFYLALFNTTNDIVYTKYKEHGFGILPHLKKVWTEFSKAMLLEAKWSKMQYIPLLTEYLENAWVSSSTIVVLVCAFFATDQPITDDVLKALENNPNLIYYSAMIMRLCNDLATPSAGLDRDDGPSAIQCYMKEANTSEQDARDKVRGLIFEMWKKLNEYIYDSPFQQSFVDIAMNHARTAHSFYRLGDGVSFQDLEASKYIAGLLIKPIINESG